MPLGVRLTLFLLLPTAFDLICVTRFVHAAFSTTSSTALTLNSKGSSSPLGHLKALVGKVVVALLLLGGGT